MKQFNLLLIALCFFCTPVFAQENLSEENDTEVYEDESVYLDYNSRDPFRMLDTVDFGMGIHLVTLPFLHQQAFGLGLDFQVRYTNNLSAGLSFAVAGRKVNPKFGYNIGESKLLYYEFNIYHEMKLLQWKRLAVAARLEAGYAAFHLSDNSIKEKYWWYDEYGNAYEGERALPIATNKFFKVAPAVLLRYQFNGDVALEGGAGYNAYIGNPEYGSRSDFNNYRLQLGIKIGIN